MMNEPQIKDIKDYWMKLDGWRLEVGLIFLIGEDPDEFRCIYGGSEETQKSLLREKWHFAVMAIKAGKLKLANPPIEVTDDWDYLNCVVLPKDFIDWAIEKGFELPKEMFEVLGISEDKMDVVERRRENPKVPPLVSEQQIKDVVANNAPRAVAKKQDWYCMAMPLCHKYKEEHGVLPTTKVLAKLILTEHSGLQWKAGTINRELNKEELEKKYTEYEKSLSVGKN